MVEGYNQVRYFGLGSKCPCNFCIRHSVSVQIEIVSSILHHKSQEALVEEEEEGEVHAERTHEGELEQVEKDQEEGQVIGLAEKELIGAGEEDGKKKPTFVIQVGQRGMKIPKKRRYRAAGFMDEDEVISKKPRSGEVLMEEYEQILEQATFQIE